jgi:predicted component of type VI protein secretion system
MGRIKSALEIALEKTESVKSDKNSISQFEAKQKGKKIANDFLSGELPSLEAEIKKSSKEEVESLKRGIFDALITQIILPLDEEDLKRVETAGQGLHTVINNSKFTILLKQLSQALSQYLKESAQYEEAIMRQYAPKLRQKEEELSRRMGRAVKIDPFQDPEFAAFFNQNMNALKSNYQGAINQVREEAGRLFRGE